MEPFLPYEYTCEGMLERVHAYIQHQVRENTDTDVLPAAVICQINDAFHLTCGIISPTQRHAGIKLSVYILVMTGLNKTEICLINTVTKALK